MFRDQPDGEPRPPGADPLRCAIYARSSSVTSATEDLAEQLRRCGYRARHIAARLAPGDVFTDVASCGHSIGERPGLAELMLAVEAGNCDVIIVEDLDRLSRQLGGQDLSRSIATLERRPSRSPDRA